MSSYISCFGRTLAPPYNTFTFPSSTVGNPLLYIDYVLYDTMSGAVTWLKLATDRANVLQYFLNASGHHYTTFEMTLDNEIVAHAVNLPQETPGVYPLVDINDSNIVWGFIYTRDGFPDNGEITNTSASRVNAPYGISPANWVPYGVLNGSVRIPFMLQILDSDASATLNIMVHLGDNELSPHNGFPFDNIVHYGLGTPIYGEVLIQANGENEGVYYLRTSVNILTNQPDQAGVIVVQPLPQDSEYELTELQFLRLTVSSSSGSFTYAYFWAHAEYIPPQEDL